MLSDREVGDKPNNKEENIEGGREKSGMSIQRKAEGAVLGVVQHSLPFLCVLGA